MINGGADLYNSICISYAFLNTAFEPSVSMLLEEQY